MAYYEGEISPMCWGGNNNGSFGNGWEGLIGLALVAGLFDNGNGGLFGNRGGNNGNCSVAGLATQADLSAGFNNSAVLSNLNDIILGQAQMQNFINQGFAGVNQSVTSGVSSLQQTLCQGFNGIDRAIADTNSNLANAICTLGYQNQSGFNALSNQIASCCCDLKTMNLENRYLNEKQTCDIVSAINAGNQRLVDIYTADKMASKDARIATLESIISNKDQTETILRAVNRDRCPEPAYIVPNPNCCYNYGVFPMGACGASVQ